MQTENIEDIYNLTPVQKGILFHSLYAPEFGQYIFQTTFTLRGSLNVAAFKRAWQKVVERHTILRTGFYWEEAEQPLQIVYKQVKVPLELYDWSDINPGEQQRKLNSFLKSDRQQGFDLSQASLMRLTLFQLGKDVHEFVWSRHFIVADGWSIPLILGEVVQIYEALSQGTEVFLEPSFPFRKYLDWFEQQDVNKAEMFWRKQLKGVKAPTPLTNLLADNLNQQEKYDDEQITLSDATTSKLHAFARQHQLTINTLIQGAWTILLSRYSGYEEVVYGCTVSGRPVDLVGSESIVGMLVNTLPVRVKVNSEKYLLSWLKELQSQLLEMRQYEYSSLVDVQGWSEVPRNISLFDSIVVFENLPVPENLRENHSRILQVVDSNNFYKTNYALTLVIIPEFPLTLGINYDFSRIDTVIINNILEHLNRLLEGMVANHEVCLKDLLLFTEQKPDTQLLMLEKEMSHNFDFV
ncbi:condensation domain-containing protein [Calothrix sp. CCY 0018]|uniref:condensation domain-containing protein n=1 Tax=Calothrix sp. CCY 0018 TaxID=3103864 RepID=UPI0039C5E3FB